MRLRRYDPIEIARRIAAIRDGWSDEERAKHDLGPRYPARVQRGRHLQTRRRGHGCPEAGAQFDQDDMAADRMFYLLDHLGDS